MPARRSRAARCAWWIGHNLLFLGKGAPARGWFARGQRLLEREERDSVERGYLLIPRLLEASAKGDFDAAYARATEIAEIGERFGDADLLAIALMEQGRALVRQGRREEGLQLVDETMVAVTAGELSPVVAGIVYCNTIAFCRDVYELRRAREWTDALTRWCEQQPDMVAHKGLCLVHRAEIMTIGGAWGDALEEARRVAEQFTRGVLNERALGHAAYRQAEVHRLQGRLRRSRGGISGGKPLRPRAATRPRPHATGAGETSGGGRGDGARDERDDGPGSARGAPAGVHRDPDRDRRDPRGAGVLRRARRDRPPAGERGADGSGCARGRGGRARRGRRAVRAALLRRAWRAWQDLDAPYDAARARVLIARACAGAGDEDTARLELDAARDTFFRLGAAPDVASLDALARVRARGEHGLTVRELEVLRLVARGRSNREIASVLVISERTVDRHVQNIFAKLRVSSRAAASVFAAEHDLL